MSDMRQSFRSISDDLPPAPYTVEQIVQRGRRSRRRRTGAQTVGAAGSALAVAAIVAVAFPHGSGGTPRPAVPAASKLAVSSPQVPAFTVTIRGFTVDQDFAVQASAESTPGYESARVVRPHATEIGNPAGITQQSGVLTVFRPGVFNPFQYAAGSPVTINGRSGFTRTFDEGISIPDPQNPTKMINHTMHLASIAWQYADDAWATVTATNDGKYYGMTAAQVQAVAEKFVPSLHGPIATAPYTILRIPSGWQLGSAGGDDVTALNSGSGAISHVYLARTEIHFTGLTGRIDLDRGRDAGILLSVQKNDTGGPAAHPFTAPSCYNRADGQGAFCDRAIGATGYYLEAIDQTRTLTGAQINAIIDGLRFTDPAHPATWIPVTQ